MEHSMRRLTVLVAASAVAAACSIGHGPAGPVVKEHKVVELGKAELTRIRLEMSAGEIEVKGGASNLMDADFSYNVPEWKPLVEHTTSGTQAALRVKQGGSAIGTNTHNQWQLALNDKAPIELVAHLGAGEATLNLGTLNLRKVEVHVGAGEAVVDLRGTPTTSYTVDIEGGVGEARVKVPANVAISASASGVIGDINVQGLEKRDGRWINPRAPSSAVTITLNVKGAIGEIRITAE
jgi:hypothetical protein